jgi:GntR family transcriptional regulator
VADLDAPSEGSVREPVYYRLKQDLLATIEAAEVGTRLPSERALAEEFGTSRASVRLALQELVVEGRLRREHGSGTYVARPKLAQPLQLSSYTSEARAAGFEPGTEILELATVPAGPRVGARLGVAPSTRVVLLVRLRTADGLPMAIERTHLVSSRFPHLRRHLTAEGSLYRVMREEYGAEPYESQDTIETGVLSPDDAALLRTEVGLPALRQTRLAVDRQGVPLEWTESIYRGDRFTLVAHLRRDPRR